MRYFYKIIEKSPSEDLLLPAAESFNPTRTHHVFEQQLFCLCQKSPQKKICPPPWIFFCWCPCV